MPQVTGYLGQVDFSAIRSLNVTLGANEYPSGVIKFNSYWRNSRSNNAQTATVWLCDSAGNNAVKLFDLSAPAGGSDSTHNSATINAPGLKGKALYLKFTNVSYPYQFYYANGSNVTIDTAYDTFSVTCSAGTGGSLSASTANAQPGSTVTLYPSANTGYQLSSYTTNPAVTITNNQFTMPSSAVTITANYSKINYTITKGSNPAGAGTVSGPDTAQMGDSVSISQTPATGYYFTGWTTTPANLGNAFTMPAGNVSITANYIRRSTATLDNTTLTGGTNAALTISTDSSAYTHKYQLSFGTGMATALTDVAAGVTGVTIAIPDSWATQIPNEATKSGGTLTLYTYSGTTLIGTYTITGLTYAVPTSARPEISGLAASVARTIGSVTYANIGDIYTQGHCGVKVEASASSGYGATITSLTAAIGGYSGSEYNGSIPSGGFISGLLTIAGQTTITVTAEDSRGFTVTETVTIAVTMYNAPSGLLAVRRVDALGQDDDVGEYARYQLTKYYTVIGSNSLTVTMTSQSYSEVLATDAGDILPSSRQQFSLQQEYTITVTLQDAFETVTLTAKLRSGQFIIFVSADGNKLGFMKAANKQIPTGKDNTVEFSADTQIYIGDDTLEDYIRAIVQNM